jgi:hypothetical protein
MNLEALSDLDLDANHLLDKDRLLALFGLRTQRPASVRVAHTLGTFGVGLLVGAGLAILLAPKPGRRLRADLRGRLRQVSAELDYVGHPTSVCGSLGAYRSG